jgi:hypothetical protein
MVFTPTAHSLAASEDSGVRADFYAARANYPHLRTALRDKRDIAIFNQITAQADRLRGTDASLAARLDLTAYPLATGHSGPLHSTDHQCSARMGAPWPAAAPTRPCDCGM